MLHTGIWSAAVFLATFAAATSAQSRVWTVDDDVAGADFADIQPAIDAAASGDVLLVRAGDYLPFDLDGKGVSILGDDGGNVQVSPPAGFVTSSIRNVPAGERAVVRGVTFVLPIGQIFDETILIADCSGLVWLESVVVLRSTYPLPFFVSTQGAAISVERSAEVVVVDSRFEGEKGSTEGFGPEIGAVGMNVDASRAYVHGCTFEAGATTVLGGFGRPGVRTRNNSTLVLRDSTVLAAQGGAGFPLGGPGPGDGGPGIRVAGGVVWSIATDLVGGPAGTDFFGSFGNPGPSIETSGGGIVQEAPSDRAKLSTAPVVREDNAAILTLETTPSSSLALFASFDSTPVFVPGLPGFLGVGFAPIVVPVGATDAAGAFSLPVLFGDLPTGLETYAVNVQFGVLTQAPTVALSNPSIVTIVPDTL